MQPKIFGIGFSKTGTTSLRAALEILGYRTIRSLGHNWPPAEGETFDAATHEMVAADFAALDRRWSNSRFICTTRGHAIWLPSIRRQLVYRQREGLPVNPGLDALLGQPANVPISDGELLAAYDQHLSQVRAHFAGRPGDLLLIDLCGAPDWTALCAFLGRPVPMAPFPHENAEAGRLRWLREHLGRTPPRHWPRRLRKRLVKPLVKAVWRRLRKPAERLARKLQLALYSRFEGLRVRPLRGRRR